MTIKKISKNESFFARYLRINDLSKILERDRRTIHRYINDGILPAPYKLPGGKYAYFDPDEVQQHITKFFVQAPKESPFTMRPSH